MGEAGLLVGEAQEARRGSPPRELADYFSCVVLGGALHQSRCIVVYKSCVVM